MNLIPEGTWRARGRETALGLTNSGSEQVGVDLEILEGPATGRRITWYGYFTDKTFERTIESLRHLGWQGVNLAELNADVGQNGCGANEVNVVIGHEPDQHGELRAKAQWINPLGGVAMKDRMDKASAEAFAQRMKGRLVAAAARGGTQRPTAPKGSPLNPTASTPSGEVSSDDIPF